MRWKVYLNVIYIYIYIYKSSVPYQEDNLAFSHDKRGFSISMLNILSVKSGATFRRMLRYPKISFEVDLQNNAYNLNVEIKILLKSRLTYMYVCAFALKFSIVSI